MEDEKEADFLFQEGIKEFHNQNYIHVI